MPSCWLLDVSLEMVMAVVRMNKRDDLSLTHSLTRSLKCSSLFYPFLFINQMWILRIVLHHQFLIP